MILLPLLVIGTVAAQSCAPSSATDGTFNGDLCPNERPLATGICRKDDGYGLQCQGMSSFGRSSILSPLSGVDNKVVSNHFEICGEVGSQVECPEGRVGGVRIVKSVTLLLCLRCYIPEPSKLPILIDSCVWRETSSCPSKSILVGACGGNCAFYSRCCFVQPEGCAPPAVWTKSTAAVPDCPINTAVAAACGYGCSSCISEVAGATSGMFCRPSVYLESGITSVCAPFAECPGNSVVVSYRPCAVGVRTTEARCAPIKAGLLQQETCISVAGEKEIWCPEGYFAVGVCAPPFSKSCSGGSSTQLSCCRLVFTTSAIPCTLGAGIFAVAGNSELALSCPELGFSTLSPLVSVAAPERSSQGLLGTVFTDGSEELFTVSDVAFSHHRNLLFALIGNRLVQLPVTDFGNVWAEVQAVELEGPTALAPLNKEQLLVSEGLTTSAAVKSLSVAASGRRWFPGYVAGSSEVAGGVQHGASSTLPISPVQTVAFNPRTSEIFFSSNSQIYRIIGPRVYAYAGGVQTAINVDGVDKSETGFIAPNKIISGVGYFFVADSSANAVRYIDRRSIIRNLMGRYSFNVSTQVQLAEVNSCSSGTSMPDLQLGKVAGIALFDERQILFVADTVGRCIRSVVVDAESTLSVCSDVKPFTCGEENFLPQPRHAVAAPFLPQHLALSSTTLYMTCNSSGTIYGSHLKEVVDVNVTRTQSLRLSESPSISKGSLTISLSEPTLSMSPSFPSESGTVTYSQSTCEELTPRGIFTSPETGEPISEVSAVEIEEQGLNLTITLQSCHSFRIVDSLINNNSEEIILSPTIQFNQSVHPNGYKTSIYGFVRVKDVMSYFITMFVPGSAPGRSGSDSVVMRLNPYRKYHPTLDETVVFEWSKTALQFSNEPLRVPLKVVASQKYVYDPQLMNFVYLATTISLFSSFLTASPAPALRAGRLEFMSRTSLCPIEDTDDPLPFSVHPFQIPIGGGKFRYYFGATVLNTALILGLAFLHLGIALWCFIAIGGAETRPFPKALSFVRFPSMMVSPFVLFFQPTITSAFKVVWNGSQDVERGERAVAAVALLFGVLFVVFVAFILHPKNFKAEAKTEPEVVFAFILAVVNSPSLSNLDRCKTGQATIGLLFLIYAVFVIAFDPLQARLVRLLFYISAVTDLVAVVSSFLRLGFVFHVVAMAAIVTSSVCLMGIGLINLAVVFVFDTKRFRDFIARRRQTHNSPPRISNSQSVSKDSRLLSPAESASDSSDAETGSAEQAPGVVALPELISGRWNKGYVPHTVDLSDAGIDSQQIQLNPLSSSPSLGPRKVVSSVPRRTRPERVTTLPLYHPPVGMTSEEEDDDFQRQLAIKRELEIKRKEDEAIAFRNSKEGRIPTDKHELELWNLL